MIGDYWRLIIGDYVDSFPNIDEGNGDERQYPG